jgi:hypothetical protein
VVETRVGPDQLVADPNLYDAILYLLRKRAEASRASDREARLKRTLGAG